MLVSVTRSIFRARAQQSNFLMSAFCSSVKGMILQDLYGDGRDRRILLQDGSMNTSYPSNRMYSVEYVPIKMLRRQGNAMSNELYVRVPFSDL